MKTGNFKGSLAILSGVLWLVGSANGADLLLNGSFESYSGGGDLFGERGTNDWTGYFSRTEHTASGWYDGPAIPASENPGTYFCWRPAADWGMWDNFTTPEDENFFLVNEMYAYALTQTVFLTNALSTTAIDSGFGGYTLSAWLASYNVDPEQPYLVLRFFDEGTAQLGSNVIFDRTTNRLAVTYADSVKGTNVPPDLTNDHEWIKYVATGSLPTGARKATVYVTRSPKVGKSSSPDTYVDLVKLDVSDGTQGAPSLASAPTPANQTALAGDAASIGIVTANGLQPITYQWRLNGTDLPGKTNQSLVFPVVLPSDAGSYDVVASNSLGSVTSPPPAAVLTVINPSVFVTGQWDFNSNLLATCGIDLQYFDATVAADTSFATTTTFGISDIGGQPTTVMHFVPSSSAWGGYKMYHAAAPSGGGTNVNQYTLIFDVYYPGSTINTWGSFFQTGVGNTGDGDFFVRPDSNGGGIGISSSYQGTVTVDTWHRIAFAFDLSGPGSFPVLTKFIDGVKVGHRTSGLSAKDGRFSLGPYALLLADENGDIRQAYVSSIQFSNGRRPDAFIAALGGPSAAKIPGAIKAVSEGGSTVIRWTGGVPLQSADSLAGPWTTLGVSSPYSPPIGSQPQFYRPKIP